MNRRALRNVLILVAILALAGWLVRAGTASSAPKQEKATSDADKSAAESQSAVSNAPPQSVPPSSADPAPVAAPRQAGQTNSGAVRVPDLAAVAGVSPSAAVTPTQRPTAPKRTFADVLEGVDLTIPGERERVAAKMRAATEESRLAAIERAKEIGLPIRREAPGGRVEEVVGIDENGQILYNTTYNVAAAVSTAADLLQVSPYSLNGTGMLVGVWDGGAVRATHQEMSGRASIRDGSTIIDHATHVGGTLIASGVNASAKGMATAATLHSYDWNGDLEELVLAGAVTSAETNKVLVSNHSYGNVAGWRYVAGGSPYRVWEWWGDGTTAAGFEYDFGRYGSSSRSNDLTAVALPFTTMFWAAGNERNNNPSAGSSVALSPSGSTVVSYNASLHPAGDGIYRSGYETISFRNLAKNVVVVGAVNDAEIGLIRTTNGATMTTFSSWGPTDDGRIKPDLVANGFELLSSLSPTDTFYGQSGWSGTSMASPNAAGTAVLVGQEYIRLFGQAIRSSTMRGLLIHTADDLDNAGPDYKTGWGLVNGKAAVDLLRDQATNPGRMRLSESLLTPSNSTIIRSFLWDGVSPIKVTACWTDPAGAAVTANDQRTPTLVNNLDLRVVGPSGVTNRAYVMPYVGTWTTNSMSQPATTGTNNTDNVEQVYIASPPITGTYQAIVTYQGTLSGNQQYFSLLVSGSGELPSMVTGLSAAKLSSTSIRLSWPAASNATSYKIQRDGVQVGMVSSGTTFTDTGLSPSTDYVYRVVASNPAGDVSASDAVSARTGDWIDDNPRGLLVSSPSSLLVTSNATFLFAGQAGVALTNGITWSNALTGQTGVFARARDWTHEISLATGSNVVTFRSPYSLFQTNQVGLDGAWHFAYSSGWFSDANGGNGFGPWSLGASGSAGHFVASGLVNTNVALMKSFGLWANSGGVATAVRSFNAPLQLRSRFSIIVENNWITENGSSSVGFALTDADNNSRFSFSFTGGQANYRIHDATPNRDTGIAWTDAGLDVAFVLTGSNSYNLTVGTTSFSGTLADGGAVSRLVISNNNAGAGEAYNFYIGDMALQTVTDLSGVAETTAPAVFLPDLASKTDNIPDTWWQLYAIGLADRVSAADFDADGMSNAMEYFMGTDPSVFGPAGAIWFEYDAASESASFFYRKSKETSGAEGALKWSTMPDVAASWSTNSVTDELLQDHATWELRRAIVPWSWKQTSDNLFLRLDVRLP